MIAVIGHKNPDADSVCAATAMTELLKLRGFEAKAYIQGELNPEGVHLCERAGIEPPEVLTDVAGRDIWLVDFSDVEQAPANIDAARIIGITDHHKLGNCTSHEPLEIWVHPVGCSCTVIYDMYEFYGFQPTPQTANLMLGAIVSDTLKFTSPTSTPRDERAARELAHLAGISDVNASAMAQFEAKSDLSGASAHELLHRDYKTGEVNGLRFGIGQIEVTNLGPVMEKQEALTEAVLAEVAESRLHTCLLVATDILKHESIGIIQSECAEEIAAAFNSVIQGHRLALPGIVSRKKQVTPVISKVLSDQD